MQMNSELTTGQGLARSLSITVPASVVGAKLATTLEQAAKTAKIDGFRPGKVPAKVVKERMGKEIAADVARQLVAEALPKALAEHKLQVAGQPQVHNGGPTDTFMVQEGTDFNFTAEVEIYPEFTPTGYTGLELVKETAEPSEDLIQQALTRLASQLQTFTAKEGKAAQGDQVTISGQGYVVKGKEQEAFAGGKLENFKVVLGSGSLIPGFEEGLVGTKAGDEVDVEVTFPANYHAAELAGQPSVFKLKVEAVAAPEKAALTDESIKQLGFEGLDALKDILKKGAVRDLTQATEQRLKRQLLDALEAANKGFELPKGLVNAEHQALWRAQLQELEQRRLPIESLGSDIQAAIDSLKPLAERRVRLGLVMAAIARENKIEVSKTDLEAAIAAQIQAAGQQAEQARQFFANPENQQRLNGPILEDKVTAHLLGISKITEKTIPANELLAELQ